jgi:hypothetical protein
MISVKKHRFNGVMALRIDDELLGQFNYSGGCINFCPRPLGLGDCY